MKTKEFHFNLSHSLIAQYPSEKKRIFKVSGARASIAKNLP
ncbi:S-adenosylmethionine:tRNA ribosyltransferase-isomerase [Borreliella finlandensis]|uniref:S-adenosylmethionine:tRNA ribosyltransferase-isomerase n=1 Tax=Borreliella finlandensis TaxID=498741 RepID=A0A826GQF6_9SPIR|nr:S-adenosylmethionine:tRNA ribosyltransferase-isomerase [Borreliella finlandensis]EEH00329.1 S-adenosylmethionine:tRNA ribosyltransferase-isomerase [Borreliella finlandensis]